MAAKGSRPAGRDAGSPPEAIRRESRVFAVCVADRRGCVALRRRGNRSCFYLLQGSTIKAGPPGMCRTDTGTRHWRASGRPWPTGKSAPQGAGTHRPRLPVPCDLRDPRRYGTARGAEWDYRPDRACPAFSSPQFVKTLGRSWSSDIGEGHDVTVAEAPGPSTGRRVIPPGGNGRASGRTARQDACRAPSPLAFRPASRRGGRHAQIGVSRDASGPGPADKQNVAHRGSISRATGFLFQGRPEGQGGIVAKTSFRPQRRRDCPDRRVPTAVDDRSA